MKSNYKKLGNIIHQVDERNTSLAVTKLMGVNLSKNFMPSVANIIGTDLTKYKIVRKGQFACKLMSVGRDVRLPIAYKTDEEPIIISSAYYAFEVNDESEILSEYLMMYFSRQEFDRELWFYSGGDVRGGISWDTFCNIKVAIPPIDEQRKIVQAYQTITNRIELKKRINDNLLASTDIIFSKMFLENKSEDIVSFTDIVQLMGGGTPKTDEESFWNGEIPFFTPKDVSYSPFCISTEKQLSDDGLKNCSSRLYPSYTTFVTCRGTVGNLSMAGIPMAMNQSCYAMKGKNGYPPFFVYSFTRYVIATMKKKASGAVFSALVTRDFEIEKVFEPNIKNAIEYQSRVTSIFEEILSNTKEMQFLKELSQILLARLSR